MKFLPMGLFNFFLYVSVFKYLIFHFKCKTFPLCSIPENYISLEICKEI